MTSIRSLVNESNVVGTMFVCPSLTTYEYINPSLRIYEVDYDTNMLINYY